MARRFVYNGMELNDVAGLTPEQVRQLHAATYPELTTATITGPEKQGDDEVWKFARAVGAKG
jgi:PRTRC genetic system protein C